MIEKIKYTSLYTALLTGLLAAVNVQFVFAQDEEPVDGSGPFNQQSTGSQDLYGWLQTVIDLLAIVAGLVFVISFIIAGYQYMTARDNAQQVSAAKERMVTTSLTFALFVFGYAFIQWLVPGGIF